ncbi:MAG: SprT family zinc-dependent metalloprotease [Bacteroidota bacterium]
MHKTENIIRYPDLGFVRYVRNRQAKNLSIRISRQGEVRVTVPRYVSFRKAEAFVGYKKQWISRKLHEIKARQGDAAVMKEGDQLKVRGKSIPICLTSGQESVEEAIWRILLKEAREYLPQRTEALANQYGFRISGVKVRRMKSRWGSCTPKDGINLNSWLIMLPDHLLDYVILHELVHTRHRDHGPGFWDALDTLTGGRSMELRRELREQQIMLIHAE